jgi:hypothetical protein
VQRAATEQQRTVFIHTPQHLSYSSTYRRDDYNYETTIQLDSDKLLQLCLILVHFAQNGKWCAGFFRSSHNMSAAAARPAEPAYAACRPNNNATAPSHPANPRLPTTLEKEVDLVKSMTHQMRICHHFLANQGMFQSALRMVYLLCSEPLAVYCIFGFLEIRQ